MYTIIQELPDGLHLAALVFYLRLRGLQFLSSSEGILLSLSGIIIKPSPLGEVFKYYYFCYQMLKAFKYRIYPNRAQTELLNKHFGCVRFLYNLALETKINAYRTYGKSISCNDLIKQIPDLKKECVWLKEAGSLSLQSAVRNLDSAFQSFFKGIGSFPRFKKKSTKQSFQVVQSVDVDFENGLLHIPKFNKGIKAIYHRKFIGEIRTVTISKTPTGKFFASILVKNDISKPIKKPIKEQTTVGIDLGLKDFATLSTGEKKENPRILKSLLQRLNVLQRKITKFKVKKSNNYKKAWKKVARLYEKITNKRNDFLHQLTAKLIKNHDSIAIEELRVKNLMQNHKLAQAISDVSWSEFRRQLQYKSDWYGNNLLIAGRFEPTSKMCSDCFQIKQELTLSDREWTCTCGRIHDRDFNAAINIKRIALRNTGVERTVEPFEMSAMVESVRKEKFFSGLSA